MAPGGLTGILLVGGASRRFGSPKALASFEGETLAERAWRTLGQACETRLAVGKAVDGLDLPFDLLDDASEVRAPLAGVVAGLRAVRDEPAVFLPVDMPLVRASDLGRLASECADAAVPQTGPLPCALRVRALPTLERRLEVGELALHAAMAELDTRVAELDAARLVNVNTPEELAALEVRIVPYAPEHRDGYRKVVSESLREFGFVPERSLDPDLVDPLSVFEVVWAALAGEEVVGSVALRRLAQREMQLKRMYLLRRLRGRGVGERLLRTALGWARDHDVETIRLDTTEHMEAARALYEAHGFVRVPGAVERQGQHAFVYELRL